MNIPQECKEDYEIAVNDAIENMPTAYEKVPSEIRELLRMWFFVGWMAREKRSK